MATLLAAAAMLAWTPAPILIALAVVLLVLAVPLTGLALTALAVPFGTRVALPLGAGALTPVPLLLALTAIAWLTLSATRRRLPVPTDLPPALVFGLGSYLLALGAAGWRAPDVLAALFESARWLELALALLLVTALAKTQRSRQLLLGALLAAGTLEAANGIWLALNRVGPEAFAVLGGRLFRAHGNFGQPNPFGGYMNTVWPLGAALALYAVAPSGTNGRRIPLRLALVGALTAAGCGLALVLSWSRGAWLAAVVAAGVMGGVWLVRVGVDVVRPAPSKQSTAPLALVWLALVGVLAITLLGGAQLPTGIGARVASIGDTFTLWDVADAEVDDASFSTVERVAHWEAAAAMWAARPWLGQGPGHYALAYDRFRLPRWAAPLGHAHNYYLHTLAESGLLGLAGYLTFLLAAMGTGLRAVWRPTSAVAGALGLGLLGVLAALSFHSLVDNLWVHDVPVHLGLLLGLVIAAQMPDAGDHRPQGRAAHAATGRVPV